MKRQQAPKKLFRYKSGEIDGHDYEEKVLGGLPVLVFIEYIDEDDCELALYDRKGYRALWLERKLSKRDWEELSNIVREKYFEDAKEVNDNIAISRYISSLDYDIGCK